MSRSVQLALASLLWAGAGCGEEALEPGPFRFEDAELHARGNEPGWHMEIDPERGIRLVTDYGAWEVIASGPTRETGAGTTTYRVATGSHELRVVVSETPCEDTMSGERFPLSVRVEMDGETLSGCGERPA